MTSLIQESARAGIYNSGADVGYFEGGTNLDTSYQFSSTLTVPGGQACLAVFIIVTWKSGTAVTASYLKLQASYDGTNFVDIYSVNQTDGTAAVEHYFPTTDNTTERYVIQTQDNFLAPGGFRVAAKVDGTAAAGDLVRAAIMSGRR